MMMRALFCLSLLFTAFAGAAEPELLEPEKAFEFSARLIDAQQVAVRYAVGAGYYLYREKFKFGATPATVAVDASQLPPGKVKKDEFFGEVQIYRGEQRFVLPVKGFSPDTPGFTLNVVSQGCADIGVCYPPQEQKAEL